MSPGWDHGQHSCSRKGRWLHTEVRQDPRLSSRSGRCWGAWGWYSRGQVTATKFLPLSEKGRLTWKLNRLLKTKGFSISCPRAWKPRVVPCTSHRQRPQSCWRQIASPVSFPFSYLGRTTHRSKCPLADEADALRPGRPVPHT